MIAVDTNILVYAHRQEFPDHAEARARVERLASGRAPWAVPIVCAAEFIRVTTHARILKPPSTLAEALMFLGALDKSRSFRWLLPEDGFADSFRGMVAAARASGNLVFDAQIAALCEQHGATLLTHDRDMSRFGISQERL